MEELAFLEEKLPTVLVRLISRYDCYSCRHSARTYWNGIEDNLICLTCGYGRELDDGLDDSPLPVPAEFIRKIQKNVKDVNANEYLKKCFPSLYASERKELRYICWKPAIRQGIGLCSGRQVMEYVSTTCGRVKQCFPGDHEQFHIRKNLFEELLRETHSLFILYGQ